MDFTPATIMDIMVCVISLSLFCFFVVDHLFADMLTGIFKTWNSKCFLHVTVLTVSKFMSGIPASCILELSLQHFVATFNRLNKEPNASN